MLDFGGNLTPSSALQIAFMGLVKPICKRMSNIREPSCSKRTVAQIRILYVLPILKEVTDMTEKEQSSSRLIISLYCVIIRKIFIRNQRWYPPFITTVVSIKLCEKNLIEINASILIYSFEIFKLRFIVLIYDLDDTFSKFSFLNGNLQF